LSNKNLLICHQKTINENKISANPPFLNKIAEKFAENCSSTLACFFL
jgi:hypothetical protein